MPRTTSSDRAKRRQHLIELLRGGLAATQEEIVERLAADGFPATQATISRDLEDVGAVRSHDNGHTVYVMPEHNGPPTGFGKRVFAELVRTVEVSANLVVVKTFPGMAPTVGAVLDQAGVGGVLGTVAGDDTVLVIADEKTGGKRVASRINELKGSS
jgi:transcriptional regulator of arginine metabolism